MIYEDNKTVLLMKTWLEAPTQFQVANAALAVANMARSGKVLVNEYIFPTCG